MNVDAFLRETAGRRTYDGQIIHIEELPAREATFANTADAIPERLAVILRKTGIEALYTHQASAMDAIRAGRDTVIVTATASGKTLCYTVPVLEALLESASARALYLFPTKALAQDQLKTLKRVLELDPELPINAGTYDGDTPTGERRKLRDEGNVILTNPDMLHSGILPNHSRWASFFTNLKYVVIDEVHSYRGVFGSNVANVVRRLRRVCQHYGADPVFVMCSATIANPRELAEGIVGREVELIDNDGSPRGRKQFVLWNPPYLDEAKLERKSAHTEAQHLLVDLVRGGNQTICFVRARSTSELIYRYAQERLRRHGPRLANAVRAYRGGYIAEHRREIERQLFAGELLGVVSTNALELGIDIGSLDACMIVGYPGSVASLWQEAGRAGRGAEESLAILIAYNSPIDQFLMQNPGYIFGKSPESAVIDPENPHILALHLRCACQELPITGEDHVHFGEFMGGILELLAHSGDVIERGNRWHFSGSSYPASDFSLRSMDEDIYQIIDTTGEEPETIGQIDEMSAFNSVHTQAIYMHDAETYFVKELNIERKHAYIEKVDIDYFTQSVSKREIRVDDVEDEKPWRISRAFFGDVTVTELVVMFRKIQFGSRDSIGFGNLDLPPKELQTEALWLPGAKDALERVRSLGRSPQDGLLGIGNVFVEVMPLFVMSDPMDIAAAVNSGNTGAPSLFIYDKHSGGVGFSRRAFDRIEEIMTAVLYLIQNCECEDGCLSCVGAPVPRFSFGDVDGSTRGTVPDKEAALCILHDLLELSPYTPRPLPVPSARPIEPKPALPAADPTPAEPAAIKRLPENVERKILRRIRQIKKQ